MKKQISLALAGAMALSLAACGGSASTATSTPEAASAAESTAASTEAAADGDVLDQAAAAAFSKDVTLTMWGAEEDQDLLREISDKFIEKYGNYGGKITINLGAQSESTAKDTVLTDPTAAADVYAFADDQLNELVKAGALQEVQLNADDVKNRNTPASVDAATVDGKLYAYPLTADNGYFMFYDKSFFTEDDVKSLDTMMEKAAAAGKKVSMDVANGWYLYSFYAGAGLNLGLADDGVNTVCNWNEAPGADVTQAVIDICKNPGFIALKDEEFTGKLKDGTLVAGVNGTWRANDASEVWGANYAACKLPTYTLNGEQVQMASFSGFKLIGVNPHSANVGAAMLLADFVTNEENEGLRFKERTQGPSNINALAAASSPALTAVVDQSEYATLQRVGGNYWASAETLGSICVNGNPDGKDPQALIDDAVAGFTAPVTQ
ncbi:extracellular solute-binding protein [uncultured Gemmiger sp.]|uniref:extracellular solute-binding protein n=1 Tax=uncultured Gemmiger sp. TaxID=1623490 RepID=UPI0025FC2EB1|nr:extracellular solute-binding protein [uncultured Gemmiger sp.]